jgi:cell fate (sporulation/competence/biofilm development) regulator YmcA (YheA/YmcA/DUF963 family)
MMLNDLVAIISILSSIVSMILAIFAIMFSRRVEERLKKNFLILKETMELNREQAEACLYNIDKEAEAIKNTVADSHSQIHETLQTLKKEK